MSHLPKISSQLERVITGKHSYSALLYMLTALLHPVPLHSHRLEELGLADHLLTATSAAAVGMTPGIRFPVSVAALHLLFLNISHHLHLSDAILSCLCGGCAWQRNLAYAHCVCRLKCLNWNWIVHQSSSNVSSDGTPDSWQGIKRCLPSTATAWVSMTHMQVEAAWAGILQATI